MRDSSWYRNLVLGFVDNWLEGISFVLLCIVIYASYQLMQDSFTRNFGIWLLVGGMLLVFLISWIFFCVIETRVLLKAIEENTRSGEGNININTSKTISRPKDAPKQTSEALADDLKYCSNCGKIIKKVAKKCKFCDIWLDDIEENK